MTKRAILLAAACAVAACAKNDKPITVEEARSAVQSANGIQMAAPEVALAVEGKTEGTVALSAAGSTSTYRIFTRNLAFAFNGVTGFSLGLVRLIVAFPPTECKDSTCTWGPWSNALDPVEYRLTVTKVADGEFDYGFAGHRKSPAGSPWVTVMSGTAFPKSHLVGHGTFVIDAEAALALDPTGDSGTLSVTWSNEAGNSIQATFVGLTDRNNANHVVNARYSYSDSATQGDLQLAFRDLTADPDATLKLHSRWVIPTGEGRGDAFFTKPPASYNASECWNGSAAGFTVAYWTSSDPSQPASGDPALCAFAEAVPPTFDAP